jgi:leucyl/phenylalanyl-tRNA--protein transferase
MLRSPVVPTSWDAPPEPVGDSRWRFPPPEQWPEQDVIAAGADLEPATVIAAYRRGIFPMPLDVPDRGEPLLAWWSPESRGILPLDQLRLTRSLRQSARRFEVRVDSCFADVIRECANPARPSAWIAPEFIAAYTRLHELGWAHSVEVFDRKGALAGGLYGVRINGLFAGESMFHLQRDASKVALAALVDLMRASAMTLLDVQWQSDHLKSLGVIEVPRGRYLELLRGAVQAIEDAEGAKDAEAQSR